MEITCDGVDNDDIKDITWTISSKIFKDYTASSTSAILTNLTASDLNNRTVTFYWADTGDGKQVKVSFKVNGKSCQMTETLNVKEPFVTYPVGYNPPPIGTTQFNASKTRVGLYPDPGIIFKALVKYVVNGKWHYVQVVKDGLQRKLVDGSCEKGNNFGTQVCDTTYPYEPPPYDPDPGSPGGWATENVFHEESDTPSSPLSGCIEKRTDDKFQMYIMFKPEGANSKWVPLRKVEWGWNFCAGKSGGNWTLHEQGQSVGTWEVTSVHPQWSANWDPFSWVPATCPPPCSSSSSSSSGP